jgi:methionyl-tRNA formyltransferase
MNIALFAGRAVGYEVAKFFGESHEPLACLVVDAKDDSGINEKVIRDSGIARERVFYSDRIYTDETLAALQGMNLDLIILAWWPYIIKEKLINIPRLGCLNFHPAYLPHNRGKNPNFWSLVEQRPSGVTIHFVDPGVDSGDIAYQKLIPSSWEDTGETLYNKGLKEIVDLFKEKFPEIKRGKIPRKPQDLSAGSFHKAVELDPASQIELDKTYRGRELLNVIRARTFRPYPAAWFVEDGVKYEVRIEITRVNTPERA